MLFGQSRPLALTVDVHSHLVPGVDDGVKSLDEAKLLLDRYQVLGYKSLVTTPHISENYYPNKVDHLRTEFEKLKEAVLATHDIRLTLGAEYMVDNWFLETLKAGEDILSWFGFILIETPFHNLPLIFEEVLYEIQSKNLIPVYAHPERYPYYGNAWDQLLALKSRGVLFQVNSGSLVGFYGTEVKRMALKLLKAGAVDFIGSDAHGVAHLDALRDCLRSRMLRKFQTADFRNHELCT